MSDEDDTFTATSRTGLVNLHATQEMINVQRIAYKFPFSQFTFETDLGILILSEGRKRSAFFTVGVSRSSRFSFD